MSVSSFIKNNPEIKKFVHRLLIPKGEARPRGWVAVFLNPMLHTRGKGSRIRRNTRIDVLPFNKFILGDRSVIEDFPPLTMVLAASSSATIPSLVWPMC